MNLIGTLEVGAGGAADIEFINIPQVADGNLLLLMSLRSDEGNTREIITQRVGGAAANGNYLARTDSGAISGGNGTSYIIPASQIDNDIFALTKFLIFDYTSTNNKLAQIENVYVEKVNNNGDSKMYLQNERFYSTSAVTSVKFSGDFVENCTASLYIIS